MQQNLYFIVHQHPDADSIVASWLIDHYIFQARYKGYMISPVFVDPTKLEANLLKEAIAVVDVGKMFDPDKLRFDHHGLDDPRSTCATSMVWDYLLNYSEKHRDESIIDQLLSLRPLIKLINEGDIPLVNGDYYRISRKVGLHSILHSIYTDRDKHKSLIENGRCTNCDTLILQFGWDLVDLIAKTLMEEFFAEKYLSKKIIFRNTNDSLIVINDANYLSARLALEKGTKLVVCTNYISTKQSHCLEIYSDPSDTRTNVAKLILEAEKIAQRRSEHEVLYELKKLYKERSYAGRGTELSIDKEPFRADILLIASILNEAMNKDS